GTLNPSQAGPGHLTFVEGAELDGGIIRKDGGASKFNAPVPAHGDLLDSFTKVLLHFNGLDGSIAFPDTNGVTARTWTPNGAAQPDPADSKFGGSSMLGTGIADFITASDSSILEPLSSDFTVDFWFKCNAAHDGVNHKGLFGKAVSFVSAATRGFFSYR